MRKDDEQAQEDASQQFASVLDEERQTGRNSFVEADIEDVTTDRQNLPLMQSVELSAEPSLTSNHSAYINISQSHNDNQQLTADIGLYYSTTFTCEC